MLREMEAEAASDSELDEGEERGGDAGSDTEAAGGEGGAAAAAAAAASPSVPPGQDAEPGAKPKKERPPKKDKPPVPLGPRKYVSSQITISILEQEVGAGRVAAGSWLQADRERARCLCVQRHAVC